MHQSTHQPPPQVLGSLTMPKAFRRPMGAHSMLVSLLLADLFGVLIWLFIPALLAPLLWWILQDLVLLLHASLLLDVGIVFILACVAFGILRQHVQKKSADDAWGCAGPTIILLITALLLSSLFKTCWMAIPAPVPAIAPESLHGWPLQLSLLGGQIAVGLSVLAHIALWRRSQREAEEKLLSFSRAHQDGTLWQLLEQAYRLYRRSLSRFDPSPVSPLKTPPTFFFYPPKPEADEHVNLERNLYWIAGELVINQAYIGPKPEQTEILLPLLARLLHDYNGPDHLIEQLLCLAQLGKASVWGLFLWLPILVALSCERHWQALERDRVLDRDRFAWWCGEGSRLRKLLRVHLNDQIACGQADNTVPTLIERIDHLDSLLKREARQVKELHAALPEAPTSSPDEKYRNSHEAQANR